MQDIDVPVVIATKRWLQDIVIGFNFCPFANPVFKADRIDYVVIDGTSELKFNELLLQTCKSMLAHPEKETALLIFEQYLGSFPAYLAYLKKANALLERKKLKGIFQLASFHPDYVFDGLEEHDAANYTNRAPYPIIHIIREASLTKALKTFPNPELIPERNIEVARNKGLVFFENFMNNVQ